jgi:hypothetical protein
VSSRLPAFVVALGFLAPAGCGAAKLDETKTVVVEPRENKACILPAQPRPQRLTVEFESDNPVDVAVYKGEDVQGEDKLSSPPVSKALATQSAATKGTLTVDLGPDVATSVVVSGLGKGANVKLHMTNRK